MQIGSVVHGHVAALKKLRVIRSRMQRPIHWQRFPLQDIEAFEMQYSVPSWTQCNWRGARSAAVSAFSTYDGRDSRFGFHRGNAMARGVLSDAAVTVGIVLSKSVDFDSVCDRSGRNGGYSPSGVRKSTPMRASSMYVTATLDLRRLEDGVAAGFCNPRFIPRHWPRKAQRAERSVCSGCTWEKRQRPAST